MKYKSYGLIIRSHKLAEADKILRILTPEHGIVSAVARGARKSKSSFAGKAQVLNYCEFLFAKRKNLDIITEINIEEMFASSFDDLLSMDLAYFAVDLLDKVAIDEESSGEVFYLALFFFRSLRACLKTPEHPADLAERGEKRAERMLYLTTMFMWFLVDKLGYKPDFYTCSQSHVRRVSARQIPQYFDLNNGSICSTRAYKQLIENGIHDENIIPISKEVFLNLELLDKSFETAIFKSLYYDLIQSLDSDNKLLEFLGVNVHDLDFDTIRSTLKLLYKHLEFRIHKECITWSNLELNHFAG